MAIYLGSIALIVVAVGLLADIALARFWWMR